MKLKVLSHYRNQHTEYLTGSVIEIDPIAGEFLMRDAPGCFQVVGPDPVIEEVSEPPVDKMIHRGGRSKNK